MSRSSSKGKKSTGTNPFEEEDSIADFTQEPQVTIDLTMVKRRGELIQGDGGSARSSASRHSSSRKSASAADLEEGSEAPNSDYASHVPGSIWQQHADPNDVRVQATQQPSLFKLRHRKAFWVALAVTSIVLVGAVIAVGVVMFSGGKGKGIDPSNPPLTPQQVWLKELVSNVSDPVALNTLESPQSVALEWLLHEDGTVLDPENGTTTARATQRYALAVFYFATGGDTSWNVEHSWLTGNECEMEAEWTGLACTKAGAVRTLALDRQGLTGTIPDEVGLLTELENLVLKNHEGLVGFLPTTIGKLSNLQQLGVYYSGLQGKLPVELFEATSLRYLNLQDNQMEGTLPSEIRSLTRLETLVLINNDFVGQVPFESLAETKVRFMALGYNQFSGPVLETGMSFDHLLFLYLERNHFSGKLPDNIGETIPHVISFNADHNNITGALPLQMSQLSDLEYLSLQSNGLSSAIPSDFNALTSLVTLNLASNGLTGATPDLSELHWLRNALLYGNDLNGPIPQFWAELRSLEVLFLSSNQLTGSIPDFGRARELRGLYLSDNLLNGTIPDTLCKVQPLESLFLDDNVLRGTLPSCLGELENLQQFHVFSNELSGSIPASIGTMRKLTGLGLESNNFDGTVPSAICDLKKSSVTSLDLWSDCGDDLTCECCSVCCPSDSCV